MAISFKDSLNNKENSDYQEVIAVSTVSKPLESKIYKAETNEWVLDERYPYYPDYNDDNVSTIDKLKNVILNQSQVCITQESNSQYIPFEMSRYYDNFDLTTTSLIIHYVNSNDNEAEDIPVNFYYNNEKIKFGWLVDSRATLVAGEVVFEIIAIGKNREDEEYIWKTKPCHALNILESLSGSGAIKPDESWQTDILYQVMEYVTLAQDAAKRAEEAAKKTTTGQNITLDKTLTVEGQAADAKAVGDAIKNIKIDLDTTLTVSGQAADAKAVGDKITELENMIGNIGTILDEINGVVV